MPGEGLRRKPNTRRLVPIAVMLAAAVILAWWTVERSDRRMRDGLLQQTLIAAKVLDVADITALAGNESDLDRPEYSRVRDQLAAVSSANPQYSFVYLLARGETGAVRFLADCEPEGSEDHSPPGQLYAEASDDLVQVFETGRPRVEGPVSDRWGTWVSSLVPLADPRTGQVIAVIGVDVDARTWKWDLAAGAALPVGLLILLMITVAAAAASTRLGDSRPRPLMRRLLPSLAGMVVVLVVGAGALLVYQHERSTAVESGRISSCVLTDLRMALEQQALGLTAALQPILADPDVRSSLRRADADHMLGQWLPVYDRLHREANITHLYFLDRERTCILRVHNPHKRGDLIDRFTALEAERTGRAAWGMELGPLGTLTLRVVGPVLQDGEAVGYVEIGKEIDEVLESLQAAQELHLAVVIRKDRLDRRMWEEWMRTTGRAPDWDRMTHGVSAYATGGHLPDLIAAWADDIHGDGLLVQATDRRIDHDGRKWRTASMPLEDASGESVGQLLVMRDVTEEEAGFARLMALVLFAGGILLALTLGFIFVLLRRTDIAVQRQHAALLQSEERASQLARHSRTCSWEVDPDGLITYVSDVVTELLGYRPEELVGRVYFHELHPEEQREALKAAVFDAFSRRESFRNLESEVLAKDGRRIWISTIAIPVPGEDGSLKGYRGSHTDITARKLAHEALADSEKPLSRSQQVANLGSWDLDLRANHLAWSDEVYRIFGCKPQEFAATYEAFLDAVHPDDRSAVDEAYSASLRDGSDGYEIEHRIVRRDTGEVRHVHEYCAHERDEAGNIVRSIGMVQDITERWKEEEYRRFRLTFQQVAAEISAELTRITTGTGFDAAIDTALRRLGELFSVDRSYLFRFTPDLVYMTNTHEWCAGGIEPQKDNTRIQPTDSMPWWKEQIFSKEPVHMPDTDALPPEAEAEKEEFKAQGIRSLICVPTVGANGVLTGFIGFDAVRKAHSWPDEQIVMLQLVADAIGGALERLRAEELLQETNRGLEEVIERANEMATQAEQANVAKSAFLANMSHEIRTPMNGVIGMTGLLLDTELTDEQRRYAEVVRASGEALLSLINDILDFSKIEAKKLDLEVLDFDLASLLDDFASTLAVRAQEKGLEFICAADTSVPSRLRGDPGRLRQILTNLAGNAIKFTDSGEVSVRVSVLDGSLTDALGAPSRDDRILLRFSVRDTGVGIPKEKTRALFLKFSQVDASVTRRYGGTGLGLAISKQLAELMGGEIGVESESGEGSEFWFTVRLERSPEAAKADALQPVSLKGVRVLVVDDNATCREIMMARLSHWGMRPAVASDGVEGLAALCQACDENDPFRIAIVDRQMPRMDGCELGGRVASDPRLSATRLVMLSSLGIRGEARKHEEIGFAAYVTKPVSFGELKSVLSVVLAGGSAKAIVTRHSARERMSSFSESRARLLLVEDNITNQKVALGILKRLGLRADAVANGAEAVRALEAIPYDLVFMDVQMPVMDGFEATRQIRSPRSGVLNHDVPVIAMTAHAMQGDREKCIEAGMTDYLPKPVSPSSLADVLERWLTASAVNPQGVPQSPHSPQR